MRHRSRGIYEFATLPSEARLLSWSTRNELRNTGCLTPCHPWELTPRRRFRIYEWLESGNAYRDAEIRRYSDTEFSWHAIHPWDMDEVVTPIEQFHTAKERTYYLDCMLYDAYERMQQGKTRGPALVMHLPFGGLPLVSITSKDGKVTIY